MTRTGRTWKEIGRRLYRECLDDPLGQWASSLAFYVMLSLFPFLIALVAIAGLLLDPRAIAQLVEGLRGLVPAAAARLVSSRLTILARSHNGTLLTVGFATAVWSASRATATLITLFNQVYEVEERRSWWRRQLLAIAVTLVVGLAGIVAVFAMFAVPLLRSVLGGWLEHVAWLRIVPAAAALMVGWSLLYHYLPHLPGRRFRLITPGAAVGVLLWLLASWLFSIYVGRSGNYEAVYGALGGVAVLLVWIFITSLAILLGAEINHVLLPVEDPGPAREKAKGPGEDPGPFTRRACGVDGT